MNSIAADAGPRVDITVDGPIAAIELYNPKAGNAITRGIYEELRDTWTRIEQDPKIKVVTFTGHGERFFCTGADVSALASPGTIRRTGEMTGDGWRLTWRMAHLTKPVVVAVNGIAAGGALGFVTDADIVLASRNAKFLDTHVAIGQVCGYGALRLVNLIGPSEATRIAISGGALSAERAHQLGLVNELFDTPAQAVAAARATAEKIASASPMAVRKTLELLHGLSKPMQEYIIDKAADRAVFSHLQHPDATEGARAWLENRTPRWVDEWN